MITSDPSETQTGYLGNPDSAATVQPLADTDAWRQWRQRIEDHFNEQS